ncbi:NAD-dependent succinate-semialdehyde dehydrogenase [Saccharococcus caldoxylosilyticus]|uniref:Aldehyde dehydrogenase n=1 Tax=Parageobacillus caldoxylosilyticus NBRC 107762 TaxID=1220594 RepID=A0A023DJC2_9BACL|nr:NAD-dependent succinate-semialdehyde dehydrogenase [Parageobacillus caldoxylosilyticus]MBB3852119.1 succinate-semialdehyde dehydrogenase/glutarate-semialdehyde dehydrogenase [Parageobacillus caldoxylosilyticus]GAJ41357.1 succinate-semialdehyde dehydrogenase [Parageobacillus caldoxylosilyticus NBRC 107762]
MTTFSRYTKTIFIDGTWQDAKSRRTLLVQNPATLEAITEVSHGDERDAEQAVRAARQAFSEWSGKTARERSQFLYAAYEKMKEQKEELAAILTSEQGKPLKEARAEIDSAASYFLWYAEEANRLYGEIIPSSNKHKRLMVIPQPIGVVAAITPWNFPASMITRKLAPALAAGCTVVLKPAPETPLTAYRIVKILEEAGLPPGVVNLVAGDAVSIGKCWMSHPDVRLITFTGSTEVGRLLMKGSADQVKKLSLELGGHAPVIVFEDADLDLAAELTLASKFRNCGQTCICANRVYVQQTVWDAFVKKLTAKVQQLSLGSGLDETTDIGPLINEEAVRKVQDHLDDAVQKGASVLYGGKRWEGAYPGYFFEPTVLANVTKEMKVMNEETFGPLLPLQPFADEMEVIRQANDTPYGLAAYIFTDSLHRAYRVMEKLEYGIVGINDVFPAVAEAPFGGVKQSGLGKEGGKEGIFEFVELKYVSMGIRSL